MPSSTNFTLPTSRGLFYSSDDKYVKPRKPKKRTPPLEACKFQYPKIYKKFAEYKKDNLPIEFQTTPDTLLNLAARVVDEIPLPSVYEWSNYECYQWIRKYGYPQYQNTFRVNLITGRKLLLVNAQALSAMNITNFEHITHITYGIRLLFYFEMTKFMRNLSLPPEHYSELYKLFRMQTGLKFENVRRTDLWRRMQMLRPTGKPNNHCDLLERWLAREQGRIERFGGMDRYKLYACKADPPHKLPKRGIQFCTCRAFCNCYWTQDSSSKPDILSVLKPDRKKEQIPPECCKTCVPPCSCHWPSKYYKLNGILSCLKQNYPYRYNARERAKFETIYSTFSEGADFFAHQQVS
ncbi:uncharacterized protein [Eurosta solidaginis]|uniref:uncharacterized protein n=1 Tax=Eurosta solidaginis TaxID=178769 RepID=UPI003530DCC4